MTLAYEKGIMNIQNRRQRRCVIGKVIPKKFVWYHADPLARARPQVLPRESMFKTEDDYVTEQMRRNREAASQAILLEPGAEGTPSVWFFIVALVLFLAVIAAVWSASAH